MTTVERESRARWLTLTTSIIWENLGKTFGTRDFSTLSVPTDQIDTVDFEFHT